MVFIVGCWERKHIGGDDFYFQARAHPIMSFGDIGAIEGRAPAADRPLALQNSVHSVRASADRLPGKTDWKSLEWFLWVPLLLVFIAGSPVHRSIS
jgi:hypothetical protein